MAPRKAPQWAIDHAEKCAETEERQYAVILVSGVIAIQSLAWARKLETDRNVETLYVTREENR